MGAEREVRRAKHGAANIPAPVEDANLPPVEHKFKFRDRNDAQGVAAIYYKDLKTTDLVTGKEMSVAEMAKALEKDLDKANARYNSSRKAAEVQKDPFDREKFAAKWLEQHASKDSLAFDGEVKSVADFVKDARQMVHGKTAHGSPLVAEAVAVHFKENRKVSDKSLQEFVTKNFEQTPGGIDKLKHDVKIDDERHGTVHLGVLHLKGRSGAGLPGGSISLNTDDRSWGTDSERVLKTKEIKPKS